VNGPQNYKFAEDIIDQARRFMAETLAETSDKDEVTEIFSQHNAMALQALVHAVLALTAATAQNIRVRNAMDAGQADDWIEVCK